MARAFARKLALGTVAAVALAATPAAAQQRRVELVVTPDGVRLDYPRDGVWRVKARRVAEHRARLRAARQFEQLNAPMAAQAPEPSPAAITGTLFMPSVLVSFKNTDTTALPKALAYNQVFYTTTPLAGRSYTLRTFYEELSNGAFSVQGATFGWTQNDTTSSYFLAACGPGTNPLGCPIGRQRTRELFVEALAQIDASVNFGLYDNNGMDGVPNSVDDDGYVDVVQFVQPLRGAECSGPGYGAHAFSLSGLAGIFSPYITNDPRPGGGFVRVDPYHIVAGVGGTSCFSNTEIMAIGTAAHELGHGLGLPDLYDTDGGDSDNSEGIGEWGLMGSGNYTSLESPAHFEAWSKEQMGWVALRELTAAGTYSFGPVVTSDSVFLVRVQDPNPRGEYFLLENKQPLGADTANLNTGNPATGPKIGGLLIWHVDSTQLVSTFFPNTGPIHGVALKQADGQNHLRNSSTPKNRGDAGDPYPGTSANTMLSFNTNPAALKNADGSFVGFAVDQVQQVVPGGEMAFRLRFGGLTVVRANDTAAVIQVDFVNYNVFRGQFEDGSPHTVGVADVQFTNSNRTRHTFVSWSDGGAREHTVTGSLAGATLTANLARAHQLMVTVGANGTVASNPAVNFSGEYVNENSPVELTATANGGFAFVGWTGDVTSSANPLTLPMDRPYTVTANFQEQLAVTSTAVRGGVMGVAYNDTLRATGGTGLYSWQVVGGALPAGVTLASGGYLSGVPEATGDFAFTARVTSGLQQQQRDFTLSVTAPTLATADVVARLFNPAATTLDADELRYLDLLGNDNGQFDLGDFLAWVRATGAPQPAAGNATAAWPRATRRTEGTR